MGAGGPPPAAGEGFDYKSAFTSQGRQLQDTQRQLQSFGQELERAKPNLELASRLREALNPPANTKESPVDHWEKQIDFYLDQALQNKSQGGHGNPLTTNLAVELFKEKIAGHKFQEAAMQKIEAMERELKQVRDPGHNLDQRAYSTFDSSLINAIEQVYGNHPDSMDTRRGIFSTVGGRVSKAVDALKKNNPQEWDMLRRDPSRLEALAQRALRQSLPPKAVQMLEQENLRNTPMSEGELWAAFREAKTKYKDNPAQMNEVCSGIRQEILSRSAGNKRKPRAG